MSFVTLAVPLLFAAAGAAAYLAPSIVAFSRGAPDLAAVVLVNILLGWTGVGWVAAMMLALRDRPEHGGVQVSNYLGYPPAWDDAVRRGSAPAPGRPDQVPPALPPRSARD